MQPAHRNFLVASLGAVIVLGPVEPGFAQSVILPTSTGTFNASQQDGPAFNERSPISQTWQVQPGPAPLATDEIWLDWSLTKTAAAGAIASAATADTTPNISIPLVAAPVPEGSGLEWVPTTPKQKPDDELAAASSPAAPSTATEAPTASNPSPVVIPAVAGGETNLAQTDLDGSDEVIDPDLPDLDSEDGVLDPIPPDAEPGEIDLDPDDDLIDPTDPVLDEDPLDEDPLDDTPLIPNGEAPDVDVEVIPDPEEPIIDPDPEEIEPPEVDAEEEPLAPGSAEDLEMEDPELEFDDTVESLRSPANPLFFPTDPEVLEVGAVVPLTLEQALELARLNSREYEIVRLQVEQAEAALRQQRAALFPTISSQATLTRTQLNRFADDLNEDGQPDVPLEFVDGELVETGNLDNDFTASITLNYDIFTFGERRALIRAAEEAVKLQELQLEVVTEEIRLVTTEAYYDLQDTDELVRIAEDTVAESLESLRVAEARELAGVGTRFDRLQAEVDLANSQQDLREAISNQLTAQRQIADILSLPPGLVITAADPVERAGDWELSLSESVVLAYKNRAELEQQLVQRELDQQQRRAAIAAIRPQLSFFTQYQINDFLDVTRSQADTEQWQFGLQLNWLLFDGGAARAQARQEEFDVAIAESEFADTREEIRFEVEQAFFSLEANAENIQTAAAAVDLAEESLRLARLRFQAGVGIQSDVIQAQTDLTEAEVNLVDAILGYNRALVNLERAVSNLPNNNLTDVP